MTRIPIFCCLLLALLLAGGCADSNSSAPDLDEAHPPGWVLAHAEAARQRLPDCGSCHGLNFEGAGRAVSCFACHFELLPEAGGFRIHPASWDNIIADHGDFPRDWSWTTCANGACHGEVLEGGLTGPTCFQGGCHPQIAMAPHPSGFQNPVLHGPVARNEQFFCRNCHGRPPFSFDGGFVADPAILGQTIGNCSLSFCHPQAMAHPADWLQVAGQPVSPTDRAPGYFAHHANIDRTRTPSVIAQSCALCHQVAPGAATPLAASPSCLLCHPSGFPAP